MCASVPEISSNWKYLELKADHKHIPIEPTSARHCEVTEVAEVSGITPLF